MVLGLTESSSAREFLPGITSFQRPFAISRRRWSATCEAMDEKLSELTNETCLKGYWLSMINLTQGVGDQGEGGYRIPFCVIVEAP